MKQTYVAYARFIALLAVALALCLPISSCVSGKEPLSSLSHYYWAEHGEWHRDFFVGVLCSIAVFLILYRGLIKPRGDRFLLNETTLLNTAGGLAIGVAFFPVDGPTLLGFEIHTICAVGFFLALFTSAVLVPVFQRDWKSVLKRWPYIASLAGMTAGLVTAVAGKVLWGEIAFVLSFAAYWYVRIRRLQNLSLMPRGGEVKVDDGF